MDITVTLTDDEHAILESWLGVGEVQGWIQHALDNKIRQRVDESVLECTYLNPKKLTYEEKLEELGKVVLPTRESRNPLPVMGGIDEK